MSGEELDIASRAKIEKKPDVTRIPETSRKMLRNAEMEMYMKSL